MGLLLRYVRVMCARPVWGVRGVDDDETGSGSGNESKVEKPIRREGEEEGEGELDKDVKLLLDSVLPVFQSRNPAVSFFFFSFFLVLLKKLYLVILRRRSLLHNIP